MTQPSDTEFLPPPVFALDQIGSARFEDIGHIPEFDDLAGR
jgi:uncharacterized SAM-dependent methyltransferase